jgi:hypothetical protein
MPETLTPNVSDSAGAAEDEVQNERTFIEVEYQCSRKSCGNKQTIRFFGHEDPILPVTCCVACNGGFGLTLQEMTSKHIGMFPVSQSFTT